MQTNFCLLHCHFIYQSVLNYFSFNLQDSARWSCIFCKPDWYQHRIGTRLCRLVAGLESFPTKTIGPWKVLPVWPNCKGSVPSWSVLDGRKMHKCDIPQNSGPSKGNIEPDSRHTKSGNAGRRSTWGSYIIWILRYILLKSYSLLILVPESLLDYKL